MAYSSGPAGGSGPLSVLLVPIPGLEVAERQVAITIDGDTIELDQASARQQRQLVEAFVRRHSGP